MLTLLTHNAYALVSGLKYQNRIKYSFIIIDDLGIYLFYYSERGLYLLLPYTGTITQICSIWHFPDYNLLSKLDCQLEFQLAIRLPIST